MCDPSILLIKCPSEHIPLIGVQPTIGIVYSFVVLPLITTKNTWEHRPTMTGLQDHFQFVWSGVIRVLNSPNLKGYLRSSNKNMGASNE